jgi:hypothetical protein
MKGGVLSLLMFVVGSLIYVFISNSRANSGVGLALIKIFTIESVYWWAATVGAVLIGVWFTRT